MELKAQRWWRSGQEAPEIVHKIWKMRCKSWRCIRGCAEGRKWREQERLIEELERRMKDGCRGVLFLTVTMDPKQWPDRESCERELYGVFQNLIRRVRRGCGPTEYAAFVEWTQKRWPHLHVLVLNDGISRLYALEKTGRWSKDDSRMWMNGPGWFLFHRYFLRAALLSCRFGEIVRCELARSSEDVARYIVGEVLKTYQVPIDYVKGLRRCRYSRGFFTGPPATPPGIDTLSAFIHKAAIEQVRFRLEAAGCEAIDEQVGAGDEVESVSFKPYTGHGSGSIQQWAATPARGQWPVKEICDNVTGRRLPETG